MMNVMLFGYRSAWLAPFVLFTALASLAFGSKLGAAVLAVVGAAAALPPGRVPAQGHDVPFLLGSRGLSLDWQGTVV